MIFLNGSGSILRISGYSTTTITDNITIRVLGERTSVLSKTLLNRGDDTLATQEVNYAVSFREDDAIDFYYQSGTFVHAWKTQTGIAPTGQFYDIIIKHTFTDPEATSARINGTIHTGGWASNSASPGADPAPNSTYPVIIGDFAGGGGELMSGVISDFCVWNRYLTDQETLDIQNSKVKGIVKQFHPQDIVFYLPMDDFSDKQTIFSGQYAYDRSDNGHHAIPLDHPTGQAELFWSYF